MVQQSSRQTLLVEVFIFQVIGSEASSAVRAGESIIEVKVCLFVCVYVCVYN